MVDFATKVAQLRAEKAARDAAKAASQLAESVLTAAETEGAGELILDDTFGENSGARYCEASDTIGGATDCDTSLTNPQPIKPANTVIPAIAVKPDYTAVYGSVLRETDKAVLFSVKQSAGGGELKTVQWWVPLSQVSVIQRSRHHLPYRDLLHIKTWVLTKNNYVSCPESRG